MPSGNKINWVLAVLLLAVWGNVVYRVAAHMAADYDGVLPQGNPSLSTMDLSLLSQPSIEVDTLVRDPFNSFLYAKKPAPKKTVKKAPVRVQKEVQPPAAKLSGILWGPNPVAIFKNGGKTELLKKGDSAWNFKVVKIRKNSVVVMVEGREFTLSQ